MRRQRVVRAFPTQSLCIFCACRFGLEPGIARIPRRNFATTLATAQSTEPASHDGAASGSLRSASAAYSFDPNSSLTASEQQEKWRRMTAQQKAAEERQRIQAEQQQARQEGLWKADEQRRAEAAAAAEAAKPRNDSFRRLKLGQEPADDGKQVAKEQSPVLGSGPATPAPAGQSLGKAMMASRPARDNRQTQKSRQWKESQKGSASQRQNRRQSDGVQAVKGEPKTGFRLKKVEVVGKDEAPRDRNGLPSRANVGPFSRQSEQTEQKQPQRVAMPDFMLSKESSASSAPPTTGWGARPTDIKPLEYGDVSSKSGEIISNVRDIRDMQKDDGELASDLSAFERPAGPFERRFNFSHRSVEPETVGMGKDTSEQGQTSQNPLQEDEQSHASTLDSFGYFEDADSVHDKPQQDVPTPVENANIEHVGVAEAASKASTFGQFERLISEESHPASSETSYSTSDEVPVSQASPAESQPAPEQSDKSSNAPADAPSIASASSAPADASKEQRDPSPIAGIPLPESIVSRPSPHPQGTGVPFSASTISQSQPPPQTPQIGNIQSAASTVSNPPAQPAQTSQQEIIEAMQRQIEEMTRRMQELNRMSPSQSSAPQVAASLGASSEPQLEQSPPLQHLANQPQPPSPQSQPWGLGAATPIESSPKPLYTTSQHRFEDTGYRATPFNPDELFETSSAAAEEEGRWGQLRRQQDNKPTRTTPTQAQDSVLQPQTQSMSQPQERRIREEDADRLFEAHRATRRSYAPPVSSSHESYVFSAPNSQELSSKRCARCGQLGHVAAMCQGGRRNIPQSKVFVGGVHPEVTAAEFTEYFKRFEGVVTARLMLQQNSQVSKGFGFVGFANDEARSSFFSHGPFTLHGKEMGVKLDHGNPNRANQGLPTHPPRSEETRVANPFGPAEPVARGLVRETLSDQKYDPRGSSRASSSQWDEGSLRAVRHEGDDRGELGRGFKQAEPVPTPAEEPKRGGREARRRQWEEPEDEAEGSDKGAQRKGRRGNRREIEEDEEDERGGAREAHRARKAARQRQKDAEKEAERQAAKQMREQKKKEAGTPITLPEFISVQHLSQALGVRYEAFVERLEELGYDDIFAGKTLDSETSGLIAMEYNFDPTFDGGYREEEVRDLKARPPLLDKESLPTRPPVVTIMGHVDHGKTTLLDYLRKSSVAAGEAGGITQHIGAFSVPLAASGKTVTFLDTPGHAAFLAMRQRGANVTDMVILVVAADDSVKPQTLEAIKHAKEAGVPMIVALNKVDKPEADVERCKQDLARHGVEIEDYGGEVQVVEVSGKTGQGLDALEENVVALSELLDHRAETDGAVEGWVLEATTRKAGRVATVLVRRGTLKTGAVIVAGKTWARVRTLKNEAGIVIASAGPGMPCEVDGWRDQPSAGDEVLEAPTEQKAGSVVDFRTELAEREQTKRDMEIINANRKLEQEKREKEKAAEQAAKRAAAAAATTGPDGSPITAPSAETTPSPEAEAEKESGQLTIPFIIKADVSGSAEAVAAYILSLSSPLIAPTILSSGVGQVHESDIERAAAAEGHIIAFNLPNDPEAMGNATARGVKILANDIIYRCLDDVKAVLEDKLPPIITSRVLGEAEISAKFEIGIGGRKKINIAGVKVRNGNVKKNARVRVLRGGEKVYDGTINSLKNQKKDADVMRKGSECGMGFADWEAFEAGDQVQVYEEISEKRRL